MTGDDDEVRAIEAVLALQSARRDGRCGSGPGDGSVPRNRRLARRQTGVIPDFTAPFRVAPADSRARMVDGNATIRVRDSRPKGRDTGALALFFQSRSEARRAGGSAPLATVVSLPTA